MPNHITNVLEFDCSEKRFTEIGEFLRGDPDRNPFGHVDFNTLIPMPKELDIEAGSRGEHGYAAYAEFQKASEGLKESEKRELENRYREQFQKDPEIWELGKQYYENIEAYGSPNWYDWCLNNWNTKWNAYDCTAADPSDKRLEFLTAWDGVPPIVEAISERFPDVTISYGWADEDIGFNVGKVKVRAGEVVEENIPEGGSKEAYEMAAEIMGADLGEWGMTLSKDGSTYEYHEEPVLPEPVRESAKQKDRGER